MRTEELRHKIVIQKYVKTINDNGFEEESLVDYKAVWAAVSNLHGREYFQAAAVQAEDTVKFTIRYLEGIDDSMVIKFREKYYNITSIDNIKYGNRYMEIKSLKVAQSE